MTKAPFFVFLLLVSGTFAVGNPAAHSSQASRIAPTAAPRLLYTSDWSGSTEVYSVDPARAGTIAQITFGHDRSCDPHAGTCGFSDPVPSPDGRYVAFETAGLFEGDDYFFKRAASGYLVVARADGRGQRRIAHLDGGAEVAWAPDSSRLAYVARALRGGNPAVHIVDSSGARNHEVHLGNDPSWSPGGRAVAFLTGAHEDALAVFRGGSTTVVASHVERYAWSPSGKWLAFVTSGSAPRQLVVVSPNGTGRRVFADEYANNLTWSHDSRYIAYSGVAGLELINVARRTRRLIPTGSGEYAGNNHPWSPTGDLLAFGTTRGVAIFDARTNATRRLGSDPVTDGLDGNSPVVWSPNGRSVVYRVVEPASWWWGGDLRLATLSGQVRTIVAAAGTAGGLLQSLVWISPKGTRRYRRPQPRSVASVSPDELVAPWPVDRIAADGARVLYATCGHLFAWTPTTGAVVQAEPEASLAPHCTTPGNYVSFDIYDVALAGDRVGFGTRNGNMSQEWDVYERALSEPSSIQLLDSDSGVAICTVGSGGLGDLVGAGDLLTFSRWDEGVPPDDSCGPILSQQIYRSGPNGCPCPRIATSPGPLLPADVDSGRFVGLGTNEAEVLSADGAQLLTLPIHALAAQLSGSDLVVVVPGQLRDYDASTGSLVHTWPLPDVSSGSPCGSPHPWGCPSIRLELEDAARGLAAYVLDGEVHVVRLADGDDKTIAKATTARFMDAGLAIADGAVLRVIPYATLTLRLSARASGRMRR